MGKKLKLVLVLVLVFLFLGSAHTTGQAQELDANEICGPNAYIDKITRSADEEVVICACMAGYKFENYGCIATIPAIIAETLSIFLPIVEVGAVNVFYVDGEGASLPVSSGKIFYANLFILGADGQFSALLDDKMRLTLNGETNLKLGELTPALGDSLNIITLKGSIRIDNHLTQEERSNLNEKLGRVKAWFIKAGSKRFTIRTPTASIAVKGSDITIVGQDNGQIKLIVKAGIVDIYNNEGALIKTLNAGEETTL